jgi:hypothetical protein
MASGTQTGISINSVGKVWENFPAEVSREAIFSSFPGLLLVWFFRQFWLHR